MQISIWDHAKYVTDKANPRPEMRANLKRLADAGVKRVLVYWPYLEDHDGYLEAAAEAGLQVEPWIHPERMMKHPPRRVLTPEQLQAMRRNLDIELRFPCPNHPEYRRQVLAIAEDIAAKYGDRLHGLHLDYFRSANFICCLDYPCGCEACRAERRRYFGFEMPSETDLKQPWYIYKETARLAAHLHALVSDLHALAVRKGLNLSMAARTNYANSMDIFAKPVWGLGPATLEGQDWTQWADDGIIDEIIPMNYHPVLERFADNLDAHLRLLAGTRVQYTSGVGVYSSMGVVPPDDVRARLKMLRDRGVQGACLFNGAPFTDEYLQVVREFAQA